MAEAFSWSAMSPWAKRGFGLAALVIVLDQVTKWIILGPLGFSPPNCLAYGESFCRKIELSPIFDLTMVWNRGVSFGMFQADSGFGRWALVVFSLLVALVLAHWLRQAARPFAATALGLVIGGALGNMIDRARFGAVVDFLDFSGIGFIWVFNVADAAISVGAAFLLLEVLLERRAAKAGA